MIFFPWPNYLDILNLFHLLVQYRWTITNANLNIQNSFHDLLQIIIFSLKNMMEWNWILLLVYRYLKLKSRKCRLLKPHLLLCILAGYRCNEEMHDVWQLLERNWSHFFWLTGETPNSLSAIVTDVQNMYYPYIFRGRRTLLDFRNQVCRLLIGSILFCNFSMKLLTASHT